LKIDLGLVLEVMMIPSFPTRPDDMAFNSKRQEPQLILSVYFCTQTGRWLVCLTTVQQQKKMQFFNLRTTKLSQAWTEKQSLRPLKIFGSYYKPILPTKDQLRVVQF